MIACQEKRKEVQMYRDSFVVVNGLISQFPDSFHFVFEVGHLLRQGKVRGE